MTIPMHNQQYRRDLGDGLVVRWSTGADAEKVAALHQFVFRNKSDDPLNLRLGAWIHELMSGDHPLSSPNDTALVENIRTGEVLAATTLMRQEWMYEDVPLQVGRPEVVSSHPEYRHRGLVRAVFDLIHARSDARGDLAQGITGISYYYRQFGYEYALDLGGYRLVPFAAIPKLKDGEHEQYSLRVAGPDDLPQVKALYDRERSRGMISALIPDEYWQYLPTIAETKSGEGFATMMIVDGEGRSIGSTLVRKLRWSSRLGVAAMWLEQGVPWSAVLPGVMRALQPIAENTPVGQGNDQADSLLLHFGREHPAYDVLPGDVLPSPQDPYAWYIRVPDVPAFIQQIAPVLERRLADSALSGYNGECILNFHRGGLKMRFADGKLAAAEPWRRANDFDTNGQAGFPPLVFLNMLFGRLSLDELRHVFPDVWAEDMGKTLVPILFPKRSSWVLPLD